MSRIFVKPNTANKYAGTLIVWALEDCSKIPKVSEFHETFGKVERALEKDGYDEYFLHEVFIVDPNTDDNKSFDDCQKEYLKYEINIEKSEGDRDAKINHMLLNILSWAFVLSDYSGTGTAEKANVVLLSSNQNLGQGTKLSTVVDTLWKKGFNFAVVNPHTLDVLL